ncbi:MAG: 7-cyano-7-deazaguanine synthase [Planctomycetota bacterium]
MTIGVLVSGGLDSAILVGHLLQQGESVQPFFVKGGLRWESTELQHLRSFLAKISRPTLRELVVLDMPLADVYGEHWSRSGLVPDARSPDDAVYLPGRNLLLIVKAAVWCQLRGIPQLALAPLGSNPFPDASTGFFHDLQNALNHTLNHRIEILRPFATQSKLEVMRLGVGMPLECTFSCIDPVGDTHCGRCNKCAERRHAFQIAEIPDLTPYAYLNESS